MKTKKITECAIMIALATVLHMVAIFHLPQGGAVTLASMAPIILISHRHGTRWGVLAAVTFSIVNMAIGFYPPPAGDVGSFILVVLLDYVLAFGVYGLASAIRRWFKNMTLGLAFSTIIVCALRFLCHFASGIVIWASYAPEGQNVAIYSLLYNGSYMLCEAIITTVVVVSLGRLIKKLVI